MRTQVVGCVAAAAALVTGCAHPGPPAVRTLTLNGLRAEYRDPHQPKTDLCSTDPQSLARELDDMASLLGQFLQETSAPVEGQWSEGHLAMLDDARTALPPVLDAYQAELARSQQCRFDESLGFSDIAHKGGEFASQSRKRVKEAPVLLAALTARRDIQNWHDGLEDAERAARKQGCPARPSAQVFFALEDEKGHQEWLFCDGARVIRDQGGEPSYAPGPSDKRKRKAKAYLQAAASYPADQVHRSPKLPSTGLSPKPKEEPGVDLNAPID